MATETETAERPRGPKYIVLWGEDGSDLAESVVERMAEGWVCQGGVAVSYADDDFCYFQAMVKNAPAS